MEGRLNQLASTLAGTSGDEQLVELLVAHRTQHSYLWRPLVLLCLRSLGSGLVPPVLPPSSVLRVSKALVYFGVRVDSPTS